MDPLRRLPVALLLTVAWLLATLTPALAGEAPDVVISGLVVLDDEPLPITSGSATVQYPGEPGQDVPVVFEAATGEFTITIPGWTDPGTVVLTVELVGEERRADDPDSDCQLRIVDEASTTVELEAPTATELLIVATPDVVGTICPSKAPEGPSATMPPTDGLVARDAGHASGPDTVRILVALAMATVTSGLMLRRVSRRGS